MTTAPETSPRPARPVPGRVPAWQFPVGTAGRLDNGVGTLHCQVPARRLAAVRIVLDAGAAREPGGIDGVATLTARALMEGTRAGGGTELTAALERLGASLYASADLTALRIALDAPVNRLRPALDLLAETLRGPALDDDDVRRLVRERLDEIAQEDADPGSRAMRELRAQMFPATSRISLPSGGSAEGVQRIGGDDVRSFYRSIAPSEATAVIAGDLAGLDPQAALAAALGDRPAPATTLPPRDAAPPALGPKLVLVDRPGAVQSYLCFGHGTPGRDRPEWADLTVAAHVLGGGLTSRLNAVLREEKGYTYGMRAGMLRMRHCGLFITQGSVHTEVTAEAVADALTELRGPAERGITADECAASINALADRAPAEYETARAIAAELADAAASGLPTDQPRRYLEAVRAATPDSVAQAYTEHVRTDELTLIVVGDAEKVREPLEQIGLAPVTVVAQG